MARTPHAIWYATLHWVCRRTVWSLFRLNLRVLECVYCIVYMCMKQSQTKRKCVRRSNRDWVQAENWKQLTWLLFIEVTIVIVLHFVRTIFINSIVRLFFSPYAFILPLFCWPFFFFFRRLLSNDLYFFCWCSTFLWAQ